MGCTMKSITIHGLDTQLYETIRKKAKREKISLNKTTKELLRESLGIKKTAEDTDHHEDFVDMCGVWSQKELIEFENSIKELRTVDAKDWQ